MKKDREHPALEAKSPVVITWGEQNPSQNHPHKVHGDSECEQAGQAPSCPDSIMTAVGACWGSCWAVCPEELDLLWPLFRSRGPGLKEKRMGRDRKVGGREGVRMSYQRSLRGFWPVGGVHGVQSLIAWA